MPYGGYAGAPTATALRRAIAISGVDLMPQMTQEQELDFLKNQAEAIKG
jgi:hypothetical protein